VAPSAVPLVSGLAPLHFVIFEVLTAVTMNNGVLWDKRPFIQRPHGLTSQKTRFYIVTAVRTSNIAVWMEMHLIILRLNM
jgi:uncharacterized membrane-anchored protein